MIESWKGIADYASRWTGRDISAEAMRKMYERDTDLQRHVQFMNKKPGIDRYHLDRWIAMQTLPKKKRRTVRAAIGQMVQQWLGLV